MDVNTTLYAIWASTSYNVTYNLNGGTGTLPNSQLRLAGESVVLPTSTLTKTRSVGIGGWNTEADGTGTFYALGATVVFAANIVLYANYKYSITYNLNGGTGTPPVELRAGDVITLSVEQMNVSRAGYILLGWSTTPEGTVLTRYTVPSEPVHLYAIWGYNADPDHNGLINISYIDELENIKNNLDGSAYSSDNSKLSTIGCPTTADPIWVHRGDYSVRTTPPTPGTQYIKRISCYGYELSNDLNFTLAKSYRSGIVNSKYISCASQPSCVGWEPIGRL